MLEPQFRLVPRALLAAAALVGAALVGAACDDPVRDGPPADAPPTDGPAPHTRAARLTLTQWERTVQDLLRLDAPTGFSSELPTDALPAGFAFDNPADTLAVDPTQWAGFQRAAARAAELATSTPDLLGRIAPPDAGDEAARARAFIEDFGRRAHRRPLTQAQVEAYQAIYDVGRTGFEGVEPFTAGARLLIEAFLQSPYFLYRIEESAGEVGGVIPLDAYEVAARLSYALWNTMPDDVLLEEAAAGALDDESGVAAAARRMLEDERAQALMLHVLGQLFEDERLDRVAPSPSRFPDVPANLGALAREENEAFLRSIFDADGGLSAMLLSTSTFANADTAALYGLSAPLGDAFEPVELDPASRRGLFTHLAFLAQFATTQNPDPIHRGVFLAKNVVCLELAAPPADIPPLPDNDGTLTNRELVELHTEQPGTNCEACHRYTINPYGFPFEMYDAVGQLRDTDNGKAIDTATSPFMDGRNVDVANALELVDRMAESDQVHACFAQHWLEASLGRTRADVDDALIARLAADSLDGGSMKELLAALVSSKSFRTRAVAELGGAP